MPPKSKAKAKAKFEPKAKADQRPVSRQGANPKLSQSPNDLTKAAAAKEQAAPRPSASHVQFASGTEKELRALFGRFDNDTNGYLDLQEMTELLNCNGDFTTAQCKQLFDVVDKDNNGRVTIDEFLNYILPGPDKKVQRIMPSSSVSAVEDSTAPSVQHLETKLLKKIEGNGFKRTAKVFEIEEKVIRGQGADTVCPNDKRMGAAYCNSIGDAEDDVGAGTHMLSYSWGYQVGDIIDTLTHFCLQQNLDTKRTYVWMCCLCVNQHRVKEKQAAGEKVPFDTFREVFFARVVGIGRIIAMMAPWNDPLYIRRVWCNFEMYTATQGEAQVEIAMPPNEAESFVQALRDNKGVDDMWQVLGQLNVEKAEASVPEDRTSILSIIEKGPGFKTFNSIVAKYLQQWIVASSEAFLSNNLKDTDLRERDLVQLCMQVGELSWRIGKPQRALELYEKSLDIVKNGCNDSEWINSITRNICVVLRELGRHEDAKKRLASCSSSGRATSWNDFTSRGSDQMACGDCAGAMESFVAALALLNEMENPDKEGLVIAYANIGSVKGKLGDLDGAESAFMNQKKVLEEAGTLQTPSGAQLMLNLGSLKSKKGDTEGALKLLEESKAIHAQCGILEGNHGAKLLLNIAITKWNTQDAKGALEDAEEAVKILTGIGMQDSDIFKQAEQLATMAKSRT